MTGGIAHDFRNILAVIRSSLNLLERSAGDGEQAASCLAAAHEGVERGLRLVSRLLDLATQQERVPTRVSVNDLLRELETFLRYSAGAEIGVELDLAAGLPMCLADPSQFSSAVLNLVINARDSMPGGGIVRISTASVPTAAVCAPGGTGFDLVRVRVEDEGAGMSAAMIERIFDPYFTTKGNLGTGLGLPQVRAFARRAGGEVEVRSEPGKGTRVDLLLPAEPPDPGLWRQIDRWVNEGGAENERPDGPSSGAEERRQ
jgi:signal transduction histidine kinase